MSTALALIPQPAEAVTAPDRYAALCRAVLDGLASEHSRRNYAQALGELEAFAQGRGEPLGRALLLAFRAALLARGLSPSTVNVKLAAARRLVGEARRAGIIGAEVAAGMRDVPNVREQGVRLGNRLTREQARALLRAPDRGTLKGKRDHAILALLVGCALRRPELANLEIRDLQLRENRWVLADLRGKGGRIRTVAVPLWVKQGVDAWLAAAKIEGGRLLRPLTKAGKLGRGTGLSDWAVWDVVRSSAEQIGIPRLGAHDLRRTCAKLCRKAGGDLKQIKFLLGHSSIQTTERYLGSDQDIAVAVNDNFGL